MEIQYYEHTCLCGCGGKIEITKWHKSNGIPLYIQGHHFKGIPKSEEHKQKLSKANKGKKVPEETRKKQAKAQKGRKYTKEQKQNMSKSKKGNKNPMFGKSGEGSPTYGKKHSKETIQKIKEALVGLLKREKHPNWQNGKSFEPYSPEFNKELKQIILEHDNYTCQNPDCEHLYDILHIHHIDYNKKNNNPNNLITLCNSCHGKTNGKNRQYWIEFYQNIMNSKKLIDILA